MTTKKKKVLNYYEGVGRRKTARAEVRVFLKEKKKGVLINDKPLVDYFPDVEFQQIVSSPLKIVDKLNKFLISVRVRGGGKRAQAEAARLGLSRALVKIDDSFRKILREAGFLTRDSRVRERKKFGLRRARRARQWRKR